MSRRPWLGLAALVLGLAGVAALWVALDRRPPEWDHANHLERALGCYRILSEPGHDRFREIMEASAFYPPLAICATGLLYFVFPVVPLTAQAVMVAFLALALVAVFLLGGRLFDAGTGLWAAFFLGTAPFVVFSLTNFQLDLPLAAMVAAALLALVRTEAFARAGWSVVLGLVMGLGMLTKPTFAAYLLPVLAWPVWVALRSADRRPRLGRLALAAALGAVIAVPWYGPRLVGLPIQILNRSFKQAAEAGQAEALTGQALLFYPAALPAQFGLLAGLGLLWGLWAIRQDVRARAWLWLATVVPFAMFSLIQNKNLRYVLPVLPAAALVAAAGMRSLPPGWRRAAGWGCLALGALQVSMVAAGVPGPPRLAPLGVPALVSNPPRTGDWQQARILADIGRAGAAGAATVAVVPNDNLFSVSNFRYEAARRGLPYRLTRAWNGPPFRVDFAILKSGDQGPDATEEKSLRINRAFEEDRHLAGVFPVVGEYPLPDGSRATLRARRIPPLGGISPEAVARRLRTNPERFLAANVREQQGLRLTLHYRPDALLRGEVDRAEVAAESALIGEFRRRDRAPLRVREVRLEVEGLLFNPQRLVATGDLEVLDVKALRIRHLTVTQGDLEALLAGQPAGRGMAVVLGDGQARVTVTRFGPTLTAAVRLLPGRDGAPLALVVEGLRVAGVPVPGPLVNWIVRHLDPTAALGRLPVAVTVEPVRIRPGRIEIGVRS